MNRQAKKPRNFFKFILFTMKPPIQKQTSTQQTKVIWWDTRRLDEPLDRLTVEPAKTSTIEGVLCLEYEATLVRRI